jgi:F-type H+-transporting ATPase subunit b
VRHCNTFRRPRLLSIDPAYGAHFFDFRPAVLLQLKGTNPSICNARPELGGKDEGSVFDWTQAFRCPPETPSDFMEILDQLGGLVLGSVPTIILFLLLIAAYTLLVQRPLERTLAERRARTTGAVEQARGAIAAAEAETTAYEEKLRAARSEIMAARQRSSQKLQAERDAVIESARGEAQQRVQQARGQIDEASAGARRQIEDASWQLSEQILRAVLPAGRSAAEARS